MMKYFALGFVLVAAPLFAQSATPASSLAWDQAAPTLAEAQAYTYRHYDDAASVGVAFTAVTCTGTVSPFACTVAFPAFTPGSHVIAVSAGNAAGESGKSVAITFAFVVIPSTPTTLRIAGGL